MGTDSRLCLSVPCLQGAGLLGGWGWGLARVRWPAGKWIPGQGAWEPHHFRWPLIAPANPGHHPEEPSGAPVSGQGCMECLTIDGDLAAPQPVFTLRGQLSTTWAGGTFGLCSGCSWWRWSQVEFVFSCLAPFCKSRWLVLPAGMQSGHGWRIGPSALASWVVPQEGSSQLARARVSTGIHKESARTQQSCFCINTDMNLRMVLLSLELGRRWRTLPWCCPSSSGHPEALEIYWTKVTITGRCLIPCEPPWKPVAWGSPVLHLPFLLG